MAIYWANAPIYTNGPTPGTTGPGAQDNSLIGYYLNNFSGTNYLNVNTTYSDNFGHTVPNAVTYTGYWANNVGVPAADGSVIPDETVQNMISSGFQSGAIQYDSQTVYMVFTAGQTNLGGLFPNGCARHNKYTGLIYPANKTVVYVMFPYAPAQPYNPSTDMGCTAHRHTEPATDPAAQAEINLIAHEIEESENDYDLNAWYTAAGQESADICAWDYGETYSAPGGGDANMKVGTLDVLIQMNWMNIRYGDCALGLSHPGYFVNAISGPTSPITTAGNYTFSVSSTSVPPNGPSDVYTPHQPAYNWTATFGGVYPPLTSPWLDGNTSFYVPVQPGTYTMAITVTPWDLIGQGAASEWDYVVCTGTNGAMSIRQTSPLRRDTSGTVTVGSRPLEQLRSGCNPPLN
ncbi:MAG TPA: hypothetical protein VFD85_13125 [Gemmatimonadales bacterium]|nr:hypothetical protein [Gemmatimonadales bacterium]